MFAKLIFKEIKRTFGRYFAIFAIIALGVGFFAGLRVTKTQMVTTEQKYIDEHNMYDYEILSPTGLTAKDIDAIKQVKNVSSTEGYFTYDAPYNNDKEVFRLFSTPEKINKPDIVRGHAPQNENQALIDYEYAKNKGLLGKEIKIGDKIFKIVGLVKSPIYMNTERGNTSLGHGKVDAFLFVDKKAFLQQSHGLKVYSGAYVRLKNDAKIYTSEYNDFLDKNKNALNKIKNDLIILDRRSNTAYSSFENDTDVVNAVSTVFPLFFLLVAALVCMTTMTRLVDENRSQIGTLKAMGYSNIKISLFYIIYACSATLFGTLFGYISGIIIIPRIIWKSYTIIYTFSDDILIEFNWGLALICLTAALICSVSTTLLSCYKDFKTYPATLMRPRSPKPGKKIALEKIHFLWRKLSFLHKISLRNVFRYKKRLFMMIIGISGCTALLVTGFGIRDSISNIVKDQYSEIFKFDYSVNFKENFKNSDRGLFTNEVKNMTDNILYANQSIVKLKKGGNSKEIRLVTPDSPNIGTFIDLHNGSEKIHFNERGTIAISLKYARKFDIQKGDYVTIEIDKFHDVKLKVSGIFENYIYNYGYITADTYKDVFKKSVKYNSAFVIAKDSTSIGKDTAKLLTNPYVSFISKNDQFKARVQTMIDNLNRVIALIIISAGALALIVMYNLTNINIAERTREIATIKVLGFYSREIFDYVFRENFFLAAIGSIVGILLGKSLHTFVISMIQVDMVSFGMVIKWQSYLLSVAITFIFTIFISLLMYRKLKSISMTNSLKSIE